ncbi:hypothetical protein QCA50_007808 [Cerrena zonata]|uniref:Protein kinase domain-containing protein n=1 Tax=Cerrena zonata TaxID=2478898 RepID=A0AAW0GC44_9APHY
MNCAKAVETRLLDDLLSAHRIYELLKDVEPDVSKVLQRNLLQKSLKPKQPPRSLYLHGVTCHKTEPTKRGSYSDVYRGKFQGKVVALKQIRVDSYNLKILSLKLDRVAIIWKQLNHPSILPFLGIEVETSGFVRPRLVTPWMGNGNIIEVAKHVVSRNELFTLIPKWIREVAAGVKYLHEEYIIHGDIRGANIFINENQGAQIGDFGIAMMTNTLLITPSSKSSFQWLSPEILLGVVERSTKECDVYSFGCFCIELYTLQNPYPDLNDYIQVLRHIQSGMWPKRPQSPTRSGVEMSDIMWELVQRCLVPIASRIAMPKLVDILDDVFSDVD